MVNLMHSSNNPSQQQSAPQYDDNPYSLVIPHSLIAATMYEGSVRNFNSNPVSSDIMNHLLEEKRADDYHSWNDNRVSKYTACSNIIANEISHLYNRDDLNFDDWQYLILYNKFKKILTEKGTCSPETITYLIYNLINMVKNDLTLRNLLMISSDDYVEEVLTKFVEMALNQRIYGYEYTKPNVEAYKTKSSRKHLQRSSVAASVANTVSKAWGWKDSEQPNPIQAPSQLKPENFYVYGRHLKGNEENINIKDGCIPVPRVVYRQNDVKKNENEKYTYETPYYCETAYSCDTQYSINEPYDGLYAQNTVNSVNASKSKLTYNESNISDTIQSGTTPVQTEPEKKKNSKRYGPRGPYKRTLIRMRMREISRMRRHIKNKTNESFFLNSKFDNSVKNLRKEWDENDNKQENYDNQSNSSDKNKNSIVTNENQDINNESNKIGITTRSRRTIKPNQLNKNIENYKDDEIINTQNQIHNSNRLEKNKSIEMNKNTRGNNTIFSRNVEGKNNNDKCYINENKFSKDKSINTKKIVEWTPNNTTNNIYTYYTNTHEGYIDTHMIYSSNASTNNSISSSPIANDYFHESQTTRFNSDNASEKYNYHELTYTISRQNTINEKMNKNYACFSEQKHNKVLYNEPKEYNTIHNFHNQDPIGGELKKLDNEVPSIRKYTTENPYHSKPIPDIINGRKKSKRISKSSHKIKVNNKKTSLNSSEKVNGIKQIVHEDSENININGTTIENKQESSEENKKINEENKKKETINNDTNDEKNDMDNKKNNEKHKDENTIWDMVQKHHKSNFSMTPIVAKTLNNTNNESLEEKDDMSLLIREHYHISENVPSSQTLPFPNAYKNPKCVKWSYTDTKRFYNAIKTFGTDLLMVRAFLPEFTDRQVYDKFKLEERKNPQLMQNALQTHKSISLKQYEQKHGKIDTKTHYNPHTDPLLQGEAVTTNSGLQLNPDATDSFESDTQPKVDDKIINLFM